MTVHYARIEAASDARIFDSLQLLSLDAGDALSRADQSSLYDRLDWLDLTRTQLWPDTPLAIAAIRSGGDSLWLPIRDDGHRHGRALASWYTLAFAPLVTPSAAPDAREHMLGSAARLLRRRFATINLWPLEPDTAAMLQRAFAANGWLARNQFEAAHWVAHTAGLDFDAFWAARSSQLRNTVRRRAKKSAVTTQVLDRFDAQAWAAYEAIYAQSWKPAEGSMAFLRALAQQESAAGTLRLGLAHREGRPVAAQFWTVENGAATGRTEGSPYTSLVEA